MKQKGSQIIYLNGASSVGKSFFARALQAKLEEPFLVLGIDQVLFMMPDKYNDWHTETNAPGFSWQSVKDENNVITAYKIHAGKLGKDMVKALKIMALALANAGYNLIIDDVSIGISEVKEWSDVFKEHNVVLIGLTAPIDRIEQREKERGDRKLGSARWQAERVHVGVDYDLMLDTYNNSLEYNIDLVLTKLVGVHKTTF